MKIELKFTLWPNLDGDEQNETWIENPCLFVKFGLIFYFLY